MADNIPGDIDIIDDPVETSDPSILETDAEPTLPQQDPVPSDWQNIPTGQGEVKVRQMNNVENIMLFGVDTRGQNYRGRSDTMIIASINHNTRTITFVSLFRGIEVKIPGYSEPTLLNAAYAYGGPRLAIQTVEANFGIPIKGFVTFNFSSLQKLVDAVNGVNITLTEAETRVIGGSPGVNLLSGWFALEYSRLRKIDTDFHRNLRQRNVIEAILTRVAEGNATTLYNAATVVLANSATNLNLNSYVMNAQTLLRYSRRQMQVPIWYGSGKETFKKYNRYGQEVWPLYDKQKTADRIYNFLMN
jgi:LCP family protein required for cell wall assembly